MNNNNDVDKTQPPEIFKKKKSMSCYNNKQITQVYSANMPWVTTTFSRNSDRTKNISKPKSKRRRGFAHVI